VTRKSRAMVPLRLMENIASLLKDLIMPNMEQMHARLNSTKHQRIQNVTSPQIFIGASRVLTSK